MKADSVRVLQPFTEKMHRFHHDIKRAADSAYVTCCESDPDKSCIQEECLFYNGAANCKMHMVLEIMGDL